VSREDEYLRQAAECMRVAQETDDTGMKSRMVGMAQAWLRLVEQAQKNSQADLVYETPKPSRPDETGSAPTEH